MNEIQDFMSRVYISTLKQIF